MRTIRSAIIALVVTAIFIAAPTAAFAAAPAPALSSLVSIAGVGTNGRASLVIAGVLPDSVALPAKMVIAIPAGANIGWVGEIIGSDPSKDPTATYSISRGTDYDVMTITVRQVRTGQVELDTPLKTPGGAVTVSQRTPILGPVAVATLSFDVPSGATVATASSSLSRDASAGGSRYSLTRKSPRVGATLAAAVTLQAGARGAAGSQTPGGSAGSTAGAGGPGVSPIVAIVLAAALGFGVVAAWRYISAKVQRPASEAGSEAEVEDKQRRVPAPSIAGVGQPVSAKKAGKERAPDVVAETVPVSTDGDAPAPAATVEPAPTVPVAPRPEAPAATGHRDSDVVSQIKRVAALRTEGLLDESEFASAKARLLEGDAEVIGRLRAIAVLRTTGLVDDGEFVASKRGILAGDDGGIPQLDELAALKASGGLTAEEFTAAKSGVLSGDARVLPLLKELVGWVSEGLLTDDECSIAKEHVLTGSADVITEIEELAALKAEDLLTQDEFRTVVDRLLDA